MITTGDGARQETDGCGEARKVGEIESNFATL